MVDLTRLGGKMSPYNYPFMRLINIIQHRFNHIFFCQTWNYVVLDPIYNNTPGLGTIFLVLMQHDRICWYINVNRRKILQPMLFQNKKAPDFPDPKLHVPSNLSWSLNPTKAINESLERK